MPDNNTNLKYEQINWGWLNDYSGYKFAPITFFDNLYTQDGDSFKDQYEDTLDSLRDGRFLVARAKALATENADGTSSLINTSNVKPVYFSNGVPAECARIEIDVKGKLTGDVTGDVTGNLTGNVNSNDSYGDKVVKAGTITSNKYTGTDIDVTGDISGHTLTTDYLTTSGTAAFGPVIGSVVVKDTFTVQNAALVGEDYPPNWFTVVGGIGAAFHTNVTIAEDRCLLTTKVCSDTGALELGISNAFGSNIRGLKIVSANPNTAAVYSYDSTKGENNTGQACGVKIYGAVWNDYAEFRNQEEDILPGYCVCSSDNGKVSKTTEKFAACDGIVSDTYGFAIGDTDECRTPLAVAGRVLAYCGEDRNTYHAGDTVCAGPEGKVYKMTREEIREWPDRIVGVVSEIPVYEEWDNGIKVNGRIWVNVK